MNIGDRFILGTWGLSGPITRQGKTLYYGYYDKEESLSIFDFAARLGIYFMDVASSYGDGNGYALIKAWQAKNNNHLFELVAKVGRPIVNQIPTSILHPRAIFNEIEESVHCLGPINTILIKDPPAEVFYDNQLQILLDLIETRYANCRVGFASHLTLDYQKLICPGRNRIAQIEYNGINFHFAEQAIKQLKDQQWEIWSMQPLAYGFLAGTYMNGQHDFTENDWRYYLSKDKRQFLQYHSHQFFNLFIEHVKNYSFAEIAIAFCLANPFIDKVVIGPKTIQQLANSVHALKLATQKDFIDFCEKIRKTIIF